jgi:hypothetical protein
MLLGRLADSRAAYRGILAYRATIPLLDSLVSRILTDPARQYGQLRVAGSFGFIAISVLVQLTGWVSGDASRSFDGFDAKFWVVMGVIFLVRFGIGAYYSFFSLYLKQAFPAANVSLLWAIGPLAEAFTIWSSGSLIKRWGIRTLLILSLAAMSVRLGLFIVAPSILVVALAQLLHAFTFGTFHTSAVAFVNEKIDHDNRGVGMAIYGAGRTACPRCWQASRAATSCRDTGS